MALYLISYDLHRARDYRALHAALEYWNAKRLLESLWVAELLGPADVVRDILLRDMDGDDSLVVIEVERTAEWAVMRASADGIEWLKAKVPFHDRIAA